MLLNMLNETESNSIKRFYRRSLTWLSSPSVISIKKNRADQIGPPGICATASGYAMKANPKPDIDKKCNTDQPVMLALYNTTMSALHLGGSDRPVLPHKHITYCNRLI